MNGMSFFNGSQWQKLPFTAIAIDITHAGDIYLLGGDQGTYGHCLYKLDELDRPHRVSQDPALSGKMFCTNGYDISLITTDGRLNFANLYTNTFKFGDTYALEADRGSDDSFYWLGSDTFTPGNKVYKLADGDYGYYAQQLPGKAERLTVDQSGNPWIIDANLDIYRFRSDTPMAVDGKGTAISIANDLVCVAGLDSRIYGATYTYHTITPWVEIADVTHTPVQLAISPNGVLWYIDPFNNVYKRV